MTAVLCTLIYWSTSAGRHEGAEEFNIIIEIAGYSQAVLPIGAIGAVCYLVYKAVLLVVDCTTD